MKGLPAIVVTLLIGLLFLVGVVVESNISLAHQETTWSTDRVSSTSPTESMKASHPTQILAQELPTPPSLPTPVPLPTPPSLPKLPTGPKPLSLPPPPPQP